MDSRKARQLYIEHSKAMTYVDVELPDGTRSIGSAFHVGEGVFVTARHVVEGNKVVQIKMTQPLPVRASEKWPHIPQALIENHDAVLGKALGHTPYFKHFPEELLLDKGPFYPDDIRVDLAVFTVNNIHHAAGAATLGSHWDDWVHRYPWHLSDALILGYPPVPMTNEPYLVAAIAQINTYVYIRDCPYIHFIVSATPRGGFSGGMVIHEEGFVLGVITSGLTKNSLPSELGFMAVLSIEPIRSLLENLKILPECQKA